MKTAKQTQPDRQELAAMIADRRIAMLTTHDAASGLHSRPMTPLEMDAEGDIWFFVREDSQNKVSPTQGGANLVFVDEAKATFVSITGHTALLDDRQRIKALWTAAAKPWFPDGPDEADLRLLKFTPEQADIWDSPGSRTVRALALATSIVRKQPTGLGDHDHLNVGKAR